MLPRYPSKKASLAELTRITREVGAPVPTNEIPPRCTTLSSSTTSEASSAPAAGLPDPPIYCGDVHRMQNSRGRQGDEPWRSVSAG